MSRNPSPGPLSHPIPPPSAAPSARQKSKNIPMGITAGAEDVKYQAKYKELKRKVKEIEQDNDKLHFKVLQAKRNIQRMKVERAILYERLAAFPPSPELHDRQSLPPMNPIPLPPPSIPHPGHPDPNYIRTRVPAGPDGRPVTVMDATIGPGVAPPLPLHNSRQPSGGSDARQLPPLPLPPMQALDAPTSPISRSQHDSPSMHHERTSSRSHSSSRSRHPPPPQGYHHLPPHPQYDTVPPMHHHTLHSPPLSERRRHDIHDMEGSRAPPPPLSPQETSRSSSASNRDRVHNHQRLGPGTYINRDDQAARDREQRDYEREREWELEQRERERDVGFRDSNSRSTAVHPSSHHHSHSPPAVHRSSRREPPPHPSHHSRMREEVYYQDIPAGSGKHSRSDTPGSGASGHGPASDSPRGAGSQYPPYELDRQQRPYKLQPVSEPMVHPEDRSPSQSRGDRNGGSMYTTSDSDHRKGKMVLNEAGGTMDVDNSAYPAEDSPTGSGSASYPHHQDRDRGLKRYHRGGSDSQEDVRMGP
ncbi:hypothetical protein AAF712_005389 [Marasmius tenuissimus]|uniref:INO80 complex subunit F domain-containing protein n=1 Tax=Marasmius tenuissimus TaxID=585030 RepID=A0ABR3A3W0_9AGAR